MADKAINIAKYIINKCTIEQHPISNLQLQKILYYIQKSFLQNNMVAFDDEIEAWQFGPVVPEVYYQYCGFGSMPIRMNYTVILSGKDISLMDPIIEQKRFLNPWDMVQDTHKEGKAWAQVYKNGLGNHHIIPKELIRMKG